jgi:hypothetical protein
VAERTNRLPPVLMRVSEERVEELRRLYEEAYGKDVSVEEAHDMALRLAELHKFLMRRGDKKPRASNDS